MPTSDRVRLRSPISVYTRQSSCNMKSTHWSRPAAAELPRRPLSFKTFSPIVVPILSFPQGKIRREFKKFSPFRLLFQLRNLKQHQFESVYRMRYAGSTHILRQLTVRQFSVGYIQRLRRAFFPNSQGGGCLVRDSYKNKTLHYFPIIYNRYIFLSFSHSPYVATTQIHTAIFTSVT